MTLIQCVTYQNGRYLNDKMAHEIGDATSKPGDSTRAGGNGFKMGGEGIAVPHLAIDCLSFENDGDGITSNSDPAIRLTHCTSVDNGWRWRTNSDETIFSTNYAIYGAGTASIEGLDAILTQIFSWWTGDALGAADKTPPNDRAEGKSPVTGYIWRRPMPATTTLPIDETIPGRSVLTMYIDGKLPAIQGATNRYVDGRIMEGVNVLSDSPPFYEIGGKLAAPPDTFDVTIEGPFFEIYQDGDRAGLPKLNNYMKLGNLPGGMIVPGARGLWD
jgi:hypothetical protein